LPIQSQEQRTSTTFPSHIATSFLSHSDLHKNP
jgi:hypothetical protein